MKVYFLPGLGFDSRIFQKLKLEAADLQFIDWIEPTSTTEDVKAYAARLALQIEQHAAETILIGHSFGGIMS